MFDDSYIGRMAWDILEALDPETQWLIETSTPEERRAYQGWFASYVSASSGEPYKYLYRAFGRVMAEIAEKPGATTH